MLRFLYVIDLNSVCVSEGWSRYPLSYDLKFGIITSNELIKFMNINIIR